MKEIKKNSLFALLAMTMCIMAAKAHAAGSAGCGLGSVVFRDNKWWKQLFAMTTNHATSTQPLGITFGTSNCAPGLFGDAVTQENYLAINLTSIQREAAQGNGEALNGLGLTLGCETEKLQDFNSYTQNHYKSIFNTPEVKQILINLKTELQKDKNLANSCSALNLYH
ncbi:DUF3015 family protein [Spirobacillus cienkowskii]|jgi:hypothetical protein|uniref:DUF3015 domain-containing protein n=1 Tax=Spirobacillus cienkowskii TaxID=495820 RepID=A0A369KP95_9BACT|nr:MAG: DUF3015 domain-containing protein [Spirobacillus cienkowskii]